MGTQTNQVPSGLGAGPWVELSRHRISENLRAITSALGPMCTPWLVVKAHAYGHGISAVVPAAAREGVASFCVAEVEEALQVRSLVPQAAILLMGWPPAESLAILAEKHIDVSVFSPEQASWLMEQNRHSTLPPLRVHVKVDTGMGRLGIAWEEAAACADRLRSNPQIVLAGLFSHFACAGPDAPPSLAAQAARFQSLQTVCRPGQVRHLSNSHGALYAPSCDYDAVRVGISFYGYEAEAETGRFHTRPLLQWKTTVLQVRPVPAGTPVGYGHSYVTDEACELVTIKCGYAHGYPRRLGNRAEVCVAGRRLPISGRVSMNLITLKAPVGSGIQAGDEAVLIGEQGEVSIWADELSRLADTIPYEILTGILSDLPRIVCG